MKGLGGLMKQAQKMQEEMQKAQEELAKTEITGESGGGMVKVVMRGTHEVSRVTIDPAMVSDDLEMLEDLVAAAINDAVHKLANHTKDAYSGMTDGMSLPPGFKMPF